jgi:hypothetical protein
MAAIVGLLFVPSSAGAVTISNPPVWGTDSGDNTFVYTVARAGNLMVIGGNFTSVISPDGKIRKAAGGLAALNAQTGAWVWSGSPGGTVYKIASDGTAIWVGGSFGLKKYALSGAKQAFTQPSSVGTVRAIALGAGRVYYGGGSGVAAMTTGGARLWKTVVSGGGVRTLAVANGGVNILVGGAFCSIGGVARPGMASLTGSGAVNTAFNARSFTCGPGQTGRPALDMVVSGTRAFVAGGGYLNRLLAISTTSGGLVWQAPRGNGDVQAVTIQNGQIYIGGHFDCVNGADGQPCLAVRHKAARYSMSGVLDNGWVPYFRGGFLGVFAYAADSTGLYVGGAFNSINNAPRHKVAIFR